MKIDLCTICEGAYNNQGRLTIVNTLDKLLVRSLPCRISFGLALKLVFTSDEMGDKKLSVAVLSPDGSKVLDPEFVTPVNVASRESESQFTLAVNFQNVLIAKPGMHKVRFELDGVLIDERPLGIVESHDER